MYKCPRCGNSDERYIGYLNGKPYCRRCIGFSGKSAREQIRQKKEFKLELDYFLSKEQKKTACQVRKNFLDKKDSLIYAVTGAGKTELVYYTIEYALNHQLNVGFAAPRRDVVIDLFPRLKSAFPSAKTIYVIGEHSKELNGDIILLTTHQLYRYKNFFDLLIIDEIDAFPYKGEMLLTHFAKEAIRGNCILLSATPSNEDLRQMEKKGKVFRIMKRYHRHPLPVPIFKKAEISQLLVGIIELKRLLKKGKQVFFFVPTISLGERIFPFIKTAVKNGRFVNSESAQRDEVIRSFKKGEIRYLVTTSILERGVTVKGLQVIVYNAEHRLFTKESLIQIAGRAGRKKEEPDGEVIFIGSKESENIKNAIDEIKRINKESGL
jgi:competence protein ComFA